MGMVLRSLDGWWSLRPGRTGEELGHDALELVLALDLGPVPAAREHVQFGAGHAAEGEEGALERQHPVVAAPGDEGRMADAVGPGPQRHLLRVLQEAHEDRHGR